MSDGYAEGISRGSDAIPEPVVVRSSVRPETRESGTGYFYDVPGEASVGPFPTQIDMITHAMTNIKLRWRWFIVGYDKETKSATVELGQDTQDEVPSGLHGMLRCRAVPDSGEGQASGPAT